MLSKLHFCVRLPLTARNWIESGHLNVDWDVDFFFDFFLNWQFGVEWADLVTLQTGIILIFVPRFMGSNVKKNKTKSVWKQW